MTLLDRFRAQSRDKQSDPAARVAFVESLPLSEKDAIGAAAREDDDPRVRRAAVAKLMDPALLAEVIRDDKDETVRAQAATMLRDIALEAFEEVGEAEAARAIDVIADQKALAHVAKTATHEASAQRALGRITDGHARGSVARHAVLESVRLSAFALVKDDHDEVLAVAMGSDFKDTALAALDLITDRAELDQIMDRGRNKSAAKRARTVVREAEERAARAAAEAAQAAALEATVAATAAAAARAAEVAAAAAESATPPHGDPLAAAAATAADAPVDEAPAAPVETPEERAAREAAEQEAQARDRERRVARLAELVVDAEAAAADETLASARKKFNVVRREWSDTAQGVEIDAEVLARYTAAVATMSTRDAAAKDEDTRTRKEALARMHNLLGRVEPLAAKDDLSLKAADRALKDVKNAFGSMPPLPSKQDFEDIMKRLKDVQAALTPKVQELREADDWRRFANVAIQEQLCTKMEALKTAEDLDAAARQVRELQEQWRASADVPRAQADALWRRFKAAHDEVWVRCEAHFTQQASERGDNLTRKTALCEQAEALQADTGHARMAQLLTQAMAIAPQAPRPRMALAQLQEATGHTAEAYDTLLALTEQIPSAWPLAAAPIARLAMALARAADTVTVLERAYDAHRSLDLLNAVVQLHDHLGHRGSQQWYARHLQHEPSLVAAAQWLAQEPATQPELQALVRRALQRATQPLQRYRCAACGFEASQHFWQCPGCQTWDSYPMRRVEEL